MTNDEREQAIRTLLFNYCRSPSLSHIRDPRALNALLAEIMRTVDRRNPVWRKWDAPRETVAKSAVGCWIPVDDLRDFLNELAGPVLTTTDVAQRLRAFEDEEYFSYPKEELQPGCLAIFEREKEAGTELPAIIGLLREYIEREEERLRAEQRQRYERHREEERLARERRLLSGADCTWTQLAASPDWHCRKNGRTYRLTPSKVGKWDLLRVKGVEDSGGVLIGRYGRRGDATKVVAQVAYQPE